MGFIKAWQSEGESESTSARVKSSRVKLDEQGRYPGGRKLYGFRSICGCHSKPRCPDKEAVTPFPGYRLVPDTTGTARVVTEAAHRIIAGESANSIASDFNRRGIKSTDGTLWKSTVLRRLLRNRGLMNGILTPAEFGQVQLALDERGLNRTVRTTGHDSPLLDIVFCGRCGAKVYRWTRKTDGGVYGRCRNEKHRYETSTPCDLPMVPYDMLVNAVWQDVTREHGNDIIETRVTDATRQLRTDEIDRSLIRLAGELADKRVTRSEFTTRQTALLDERDMLESAESEPRWEPTGETVSQHWDRLSDAERRLWLLRIGTTYEVDRKTRIHDGKTQARWEVMSAWREFGDSGYRERVVKAA
jgi:Recombinase zinc beta ribbon domain/Recombinase